MTRRAEALTAETLDALAWYRDWRHFCILAGWPIYELMQGKFTGYARPLEPGEPYADAPEEVAA